MDPVRAARFVCGEGLFADDRKVEGALWAAFARSPHAHAHILGADTAEAQTRPAVRAVVTAADVAGTLDPLACYCHVTGRDGCENRPAPWSILARDRVRHVGDPVACAVAETRAEAEDAAGAVRVRYGSLPAFVDPFGPVAEPIWPQAPDNLCFNVEAGDAVATDGLFAAAVHVARSDLRYPRVAPAPMEPRAAIARYDAERDRFHLWTTCQGVHWVRRVLSDALRIAPERLRVETGDLGGGFGARIFAYPEYALVLWLARRLGRPVRWTGTRAEAFHSDTQGRDHRYRAELALDAEGRFLALRIDDRTCLGAYLSQYAPYAQAGCGAPVQAGGYRIAALHVRTRGYFTTTTPVDAFRGTGRPEATYVLERLIDQAARETGRDPAALRALNLRERTTNPVTLVTGHAIDGGQFLANQHLCLARADRAGFASRREASARAGRLRGFGLANYLEANGSLGVAKLTTGDSPQESASIRFDGLGATICIGTQSSGQDHASPLRRLAAEHLGLDPDAVSVEEGDSDALPLGGGTGGSRSTLAELHVFKDLLGRVEERAKARCAALWGVAPEDVELGAGGVLHARRTNRSLAFTDLACQALGAFDLTTIARFKRGSFANGCHACEVEIDPQTGAAEVVAYTAVDDFGTVLDEANVRGQVQGGVVQGLGTALMEACEYDPADGLPSADSFETYAVPRAGDAPNVNWIDNGLPSPWTPLGVKACGEAAISAAPPAIMNALVDALRDYPAAAELQMPATAQAIRRVVAAGKEGA